MYRATVATKAAPNVASTLASKFGFMDVIKEIQLPMKIIWGRHILGLGDIVGVTFFSCNS